MRSHSSLLLSSPRRPLPRRATWHSSFPQLAGPFGGTRNNGTSENLKIPENLIFNRKRPEKIKTGHFFNWEMSSVSLGNLCKTGRPIGTMERSKGRPVPARRPGRVARPRVRARRPGQMPRPCVLPSGCWHKVEAQTKAPLNTSTGTRKACLKPARNSL